MTLFPIIRYGCTKKKIVNERQREVSRQERKQWPVILNKAVQIKRP